MNIYIKPQAISLVTDWDVNLLSDSVGETTQSTSENGVPSEGVQLSKDFGYDLAEFDSFDPWEDVNTGN